MSAKPAELLGVAAGVAIAALALAACGSTKPKYTPLTEANIGAEMTAAVQSKHSAHEVSATGGTTFTIDFDTTAPLRYRFVSGGSDAVTVIGVGADAYVQQSDGTWQKSPSKVTAANLNPVTMATGFLAGMQKFSYLGPTTIEGTAVQHYQVSIDQAKYLQASGQGTGSANLGANEPIVEDLYLNDDNSLRRMLVAMPGGVGNVQVDVTQWGEPVDIAAPPAGSVKTAPPTSPTPTP